MKSRTLCYDPATARMQVKRFFPVWILYTGIIVLLPLMMVFGGTNDEVVQVSGMRDFIQFMSTINLIYGVVIAQLLFGDLYNARLCYGLHALPTTRGGYFGTQIILGLLGSVLPNLALTLGIMPFLGSHWNLALWWFYAASAQFLCFYGISVLSALCAGNRFGMLVVNGIIQLFSPFLYWFIVHVYNPLLYGLPVSETWFMRFSPAITLSFNPYLNTITKGVETNGSWIMVLEEIQFTPLWNTLPIYALAGVGAMYLAMRIYRKRQLECCGDLLAFRRGGSVFLVLFTLGIACIMHMFAASEFPEFTYVFLVLGLILGWFAGLMLLERQVAVFQGKRFVQLGLLTAACLLTMFITALDPLNKVHQLPEPSKIQSARICRYDNDLPVSSPADEVLKIHQMILEHYDQEQAGFPWLVQLFRSKENLKGNVYGEDGLYHEAALMHFIYTMEDGSTFQRQYSISDLDEVYTPIRTLMSRPERIFANTEGKTVEDYKAETTFITVECNHFQDILDIQAAIAEDYSVHSNRPIQIIQDRQELDGLWDAFLADCDLGVTARDWFFSRGYTDNLNIYTAEDPRSPWRYLTINEDCVNTLNWLIAHDYHDPLKTPAE